MSDKRPHILEFGKYKGRSVWQCPESYLRWLVKQEGKTKHFKAMQEEANNALDCLDDGDQQHDVNDLRWDGQ